VAKSKNVFACQHCGFESPKWMGKCPSCQSWNSFVEEIQRKDEKKAAWQDPSFDKVAHALKLSEIGIQNNRRIVTADEELNRVLGGGIVEGSVVLVSGEPGIGKSTCFCRLLCKCNN
jgi:DNA repair protein RadA/Sms